MQEQNSVNNPVEEPKPKKTAVFKNSRFSGWQLGIFAAVFALIGFFIIKSFAAGVLIAGLEAEQMTLTAGSATYADTSASGGQAVQMTSNGALTGTVSLPSQASSVTLIAKGSQCKGTPIASLIIDGTSVLPNTSVSSSSWASYTANLNLGAGSHSVTVNGSNLAKVQRGKKNTCSRILFVDKMNFFGETTPPATPIVSLSASPATVTAGQTSTLTWNSTNATGCTASGAWTGAKSTSGSQATAALTTTSTYTLSCTGTGGSASANTTVTVNQPPTTTPTPPDVYLEPGAQTYGLGSTFTVTVKENSGTTQVNAVQANLSYPVDKLTLVSVDGSTSAFTTQAQNTGANGTIQIARGVIGNLTGDQIVAVLTFKVNSVAGTANVPFTTGTALLSSTTNQSILPSLSSAYGGTYTLQ